MFLNQDMHELSLLYLKRNNFTLVKYEIMYFTKIITKVPNEFVFQILDDLNREKTAMIALKQKLNNTNDSAKKEQSIEEASCVFLRILIGCLLFDKTIIEDC